MKTSVTAALYVQLDTRQVMVAKLVTVWWRGLENGQWEYR